MNKKRIKILTRGPIRVKGFINGPVLTPYFEDIAVIFAMLSAGVKIVEVCDDGSEIPLTTNNFADDNTKKEEDAPVIPKKVEPIVEEIPAEVEPALEVIPPVVTLAEEVPAEECIFDDAEKEEAPAEEIIVEQFSVPEDTQEEVVAETVSASTEEKPQHQNNNYNKYNNYNKNKNHKKNH